MKKDVIYIDIEDDITAIIGKVKDASAKIVALVPPKRAGVLQSAVNLKLLQKTALSGDKRVVLITNDKSLTSLAAGVKIPVAKNLQSRPEIPSIAALEVDDSDVINGDELPVGEIAAAAGSPVAAGASAPTVADALSDKVDLGTLAGKTAADQAPRKKPGINIPNFNSFRKRLILFGGGGVLLILFLVWALVIAPKAEVTITAKTSSVAIDRKLALDVGLAASKPEALQLKPAVQQIKKAASVEFDATGTKDIGQPAAGKMNLRNASDSDAVNVPAGTVFTAAAGQKFKSAAAVTVPGAKLVSGSIVAGTASVNVTAVDIGPEYNVAAQAYAIQGFANLGATGEQMAGGTREKVTVVSDDDVNKAKAQLTAQNPSAVKDELVAKFGADQLVITESFVSEPGAPAVEPRVGEQAKKAKVTIETTFTLVGLARADVKAIVDTVLNDALDDRPDRAVFNSGEGDIRFTEFEKTGANAYAAKLQTTGYIGAKVDAKQLAQQLKGKRYGEIEQTVKQIPGVDKVDVAFSPFWVTSAPGNPDKITIRFTVITDAN